MGFVSFVSSVSTGSARTASWRHAPYVVDLLGHTLAPDSPREVLSVLAVLSPGSIRGAAYPASATPNRKERRDRIRRKSENRVWKNILFQELFSSFLLAMEYRRGGDPAWSSGDALVPEQTVQALGLPFSPRHPAELGLCVCRRAPTDKTDKTAKTSWADFLTAPVMKVATRRLLGFSNLRRERRIGRGCRGIQQSCRGGTDKTDKTPAVGTFDGYSPPSAAWFPLPPSPRVTHGTPPDSRRTVPMAARLCHEMVRRLS